VYVFGFNVSSSRDVLQIYGLSRLTADILTRNILFGTLFYGNCGSVSRPKICEFAQLDKHGICDFAVL